MRDAGSRHEEQHRFMAATEGRSFQRRGFLTMCAMLGLSGMAARLTPAAAEAPELVLVNWGGDAVKAFKTAFVDPYTSSNPAAKVAIDGSGPATGRIRLMVQSGKITWDVMDRNLHTSLELGPEGILEEIDYTKVDKLKVRPEHAGRWGVGNYIYAQVLAYNTKKWGGAVPTSYKDVWDVKRFPGKRHFRRQIDGALEAALLADGVPADKLYPIDLKRALEGIKAIKEHAIFFNTIAEGQAAFRDGEVVIGQILNTRATPLRRDTKGVVNYTWDQGIVWTAAWMVPKNPPSGGRVWDFIASTQDPAGQVELLKLLGNGPVNPAADALLTEELKAIHPGYAPNYARMIPGGVAWYAENATAATQAYLDVISS